MSIGLGKGTEGACNLLKYNYILSDATDSDDMCICWKEQEHLMCDGFIVNKRSYIPG